MKSHCSAVFPLCISKTGTKKGQKMTDYPPKYPSTDSILTGLQQEKNLLFTIETGTFVILY